MLLYKLKFERFLGVSKFFNHSTNAPVCVVTILLETEQIFVFSLSNILFLYQRAQLPKGTRHNTALRLAKKMGIFMHELSKGAWQWQNWKWCVCLALSLLVPFCAFLSNENEETNN